MFWPDPDFEMRSDLDPVFKTKMIYIVRICVCTILGSSFSLILDDKFEEGRI